MRNGVVCGVSAPHLVTSRGHGVLFGDALPPWLPARSINSLQSGESRPLFPLRLIRVSQRLDQIVIVTMPSCRVRMIL